MIVSRAVKARRTAVKDGDFGYGPWLHEIVLRPLGSGILGCILTVVTVAFTFVAAFIGINIFPSGVYPRIVLAAPGLLAGVVFFFVLSAGLYKLRSSLIKMFGHH